MMREVVRRLRGFFTSTRELDEAVAEHLEERSAKEVERVARDPFRFASDREWRAFRRRHGFGRRTR
jgi:hypothetical protein